MCGKLFALRLKLIFKADLNNGGSPDDCKKSNIESVHKKRLKKYVNKQSPYKSAPNIC